MKYLAQKIAQVGNPFDEYGKYPDNDRILFERVHNIYYYNLDLIFEQMLRPVISKPPVRGYYYRKFLAARY